MYVDINTLLLIEHFLIFTCSPIFLRSTSSTTSFEVAQIVGSTRLVLACDNPTNLNGLRQAVLDTGALKKLALASYGQRLLRIFT